MEIDYDTLKALNDFEGEDPMEGPTPEETRMFLAKWGYIGLSPYELGQEGRQCAAMSWFEAKRALYELAEHLEANPSTKSC